MLQLVLILQNCYVNTHDLARCYLFPRSDGVGRTGAFITIHAQMERMKSEAVVDLFQYIKAIRIQRAGMVSNKVIRHWTWWFLINPVLT